MSADGHVADDKRRAPNDNVSVEVGVIMPNQYEARHCKRSPNWSFWRMLTDGLRHGSFDQGLFEDAVIFAVEELIAYANKSTLPREGAQLAVTIREYADVPLDRYPEKLAAFLHATQRVAEALCMQAVTTWLPVEGALSEKKLVVLDDSGAEIVIDLYAEDMMAPLLPEGWSLG